MITFPQAPGAYVDELDTLSFTIGSAATAVPVFIVGTAADENGWWSDATGPLKLNGFTDFLEYENNTKSQFSNTSRAVTLSALWRSQLSAGKGPTHRNLLRNATKKTAGTNGANDPWDKVFAPSLKAYFDNGGGYCYICPNDKLDTIKGLLDATLIVQCGQSTATAGILALCQPGSGLFALLDGPYGEGNFDKTAFDMVYNNFTASDCAAVYYPWLKASWTVTGNSGNRNPVREVHLVAPSAVAAGLICRTDSKLGPWKAPANVAVSAGLTPAVKIGDFTQAQYTDKDKIKFSVNMIRNFPGRGTVIWGARTLTTGGNNWAYINVRRTFDMAERDISTALQAVLFEPNGPATWEAVRSAIENYLFNLWQEGALYGETIDGAYFIQLGEGVTMSQADIAAGILKVRIGLAVVRPAEFVILEFTQQVASGN